MSKNHNILDLTHFVKIARERSLLGLYSDSLKYYKTSLKIIQEYLLILILIFKRKLKKN